MSNDQVKIPDYDEAYQRIDLNFAKLSASLNPNPDTMAGACRQLGASAARITDIAEDIRTIYNAATAWKVNALRLSERVKQLEDILEKQRVAGEKKAESFGSVSGETGASE